MNSNDDYKQSVTVRDKDGQRIQFSQGKLADLAENQFPLHFRDPLVRKDRKVFMIYAARARPEADRKGIEKTRELDKYLWACLRPSAVRPSQTNVDVVKGNFNGRSFRGGREADKSPLLQSRSSTGTNEDEAFEEIRRCVQGVVERTQKKF